MYVLPTCVTVRVLYNDVSSTMTSTVLRLPILHEVRQSAAAVLELRRHIVELDAIGVGYDHTSGCRERMAGRGPQVEDILHAQPGRCRVDIIPYLL